MSYIFDSPFSCGSNGFLTSMKPLFFKAENAQKKRHTRRRGACPASMEPLFFKAENEHACRLAAGRRSGFNGAAFFQSGKSTFRAKSLPPPGGLQWSRFFSKRKIVPNRGSGIVLPSFNGAAFFQSGKWKARTLEQSPRSCFNGAAFFQSGK